MAEDEDLKVLGVQSEPPPPCYTPAMSTTKDVNVQLDPGEYERLEAEAKRRGVAPDTLARDYVRAGLTENQDAEAERRRHAGLEALARLAVLRAELRQAGYPSADAVRLVREGREELERRSAL